MLNGGDLLSPGWNLKRTCTEQAWSSLSDLTRLYQDVTTLLKSWKLGNKKLGEAWHCYIGHNCACSISVCFFPSPAGPKSSIYHSLVFFALLYQVTPGLSSFHAFGRLICLKFAASFHNLKSDKIHGHVKQSGGKKWPTCYFVLGEVCLSLWHEAWREKGA